MNICMEDWERLKEKLNVRRALISRCSTFSIISADLRFPFLLHCVSSGYNPKEAVHFLQEVD